MLRFVNNMMNLHYAIITAVVMIHIKSLILFLIVGSIISNRIPTIIGTMFMRILTRRKCTILFSFFLFFRFSTRWEKNYHHNNRHTSLLVIKYACCGRYFGGYHYLGRNDEENLPYQKLDNFCHSTHQQHRYLNQVY